MKKLIVISGARGIGKTSVAQEIMKKLPNSVLLDGDNFGNRKLENAETEKIDFQNILFALKTYLQSETYENIIFVWTRLPEKIERLVSELKNIPFLIKRVILTGTECALSIHLLKEFSYGRFKLSEISSEISTLKDYENSDYFLTDVSGISVEKVASEIFSII